MQWNLRFGFFYACTWVYLSYNSHLWINPSCGTPPLLTSLFRFDRFNTFETCLRDIDGLLQNWDRTTGTVARADTPKSENLDESLPPPGSTRRTRDKKDKEKELREREKEKEKEKEKAKEVGGLSQYERCLTLQVPTVI